MAVIWKPISRPKIGILTFSPKLNPISAEPSGDKNESLPCSGSLSSGVTRMKLTLSCNWWSIKLTLWPSATLLVSTRVSSVEESSLAIILAKSSGLIVMPQGLVKQYCRAQFVSHSWKWLKCGLIKSFLHWQRKSAWKSGQWKNKNWDIRTDIRSINRGREETISTTETDDSCSYTRQLYAVN